MKIEHALLLAAALLGGAMIQEVARSQATALGVSALELALLGVVAGAYVRRQVA